MARGHWFAHWRKDDGQPCHSSTTFAPIGGHSETDSGLIPAWTDRAGWNGSRRQIGKAPYVMVVDADRLAVANGRGPARRAVRGSDLPVQN